MTTYPSIDIVDDAHREAAGVLVVAVAPESPADDAGFYADCRVTHVDGQAVRDIIDWRWLSADDAMVVSYVDADGDAGEVELERSEGEDWGLSFKGVIFDEVKQCRNACTFCFMRQLPCGMRPSLSLRDDDFRLSFLAGTFVTFTGLSAADEARILEQHISPLRVSLHATRADVRRRLIGKHAPHGLAALDRLLAHGIEFHAQIVLVPGENDGEVLAETLAWAYERPGVLSVGIVPLGYTKHQSMFDHSFNDAPAAQAVLGTVAPFQERALSERGMPWVFLADEFYRNAYGEALLENLPPASHYGDFSMFEDGIGIVRSYVDDWGAAEASGTAADCARALVAVGRCAHFVVGGAMQPFLGQLVSPGPLAGVFAPLVVENTFFGGNVDVTGLLCGCDIVRAVRQAAAQTACSAGSTPDGTTQSDAAESFPQETSGLAPLFLIPKVVLNDDGVTLDDMSLEDMERAAGVPLTVVSCNPSEFFPEIIALAAKQAAQA